MAIELEPTDLPQPQPQMPAPEYYDWRQDNWAIAGIGALVAEMSMVLQEVADPALAKKTVPVVLMTVISGVALEAGRRVRRHFLDIESPEHEKQADQEPLA